MTSQNDIRQRSTRKVVPWTGAIVAGVGAVMMTLIAFLGTHSSKDPFLGGNFLEVMLLGIAPSLLLIVVAALLCTLPWFLRRFPQFRSPFTFGTEDQLRWFLNWFLAGLTVFSLSVQAGSLGLHQPWGISFQATIFFGLGMVLLSVGIGYPRGGPRYEGPDAFAATASVEFARFALLQKYGTAVLGVVLIAAGAWAPSSVLFAIAVGGAIVLWVVPWIITLVRATRTQRSQ